MPRADETDLAAKTGAFAGTSFSRAVGDGLARGNSSEVGAVVPGGIEPKPGQGAVVRKTKETQGKLSTSRDDRAEKGSPETARKLPKEGRKVKQI
jgi:hypothetical protein